MSQQRKWPELVRWQFGVVTRSQLRAAGYTDGAIRQKVGTMQWRRHRFGPGIYIAMDWEDWFLQDCMAALLCAGEGSVLSHRCAGRLLRLDGCEPPDIEITMPRSSARPTGLPGVRVHTSSRIQMNEASTRQGLRFTGLVRTVVDVCSTAPDRSIAVAAYEHAVRMSRRNRRRILAKLDEVDDSRRASNLLRELIERRGENEPATANKLEALCDDVLFSLGLRTRRQFVVAIDGRFVARVDFALPEICFAIEFEGHATHSTRKQKRDDALRRLGLNEAGWDVAVLTYEDVMAQSDALKKLVRAVELRRRRLALPVDARQLREQLTLFGI